MPTAAEKKSFAYREIVKDMARGGGSGFDLIDSILDSVSSGEATGLSELANSEILGENPVAGMSYEDYYLATLEINWPQFIPYHVGRIGEKLNAFRSGEIRHLAVNLPPRFGKSESVTVRGGGWLYESMRNVSKNLCVTGVNEDFANKLSGKIRTVVSRRNAGRDLVFVSEALARWQLSGHGEVVARGAGAPPIGEGFDVIIIEDLIKEESHGASKQEMTKLFEWYKSGIRTRLAPNRPKDEIVVNPITGIETFMPARHTGILMPVTRWNEADLYIQIIESEKGWDVLNMPALSEIELLDAKGKPMVTKVKELDAETGIEVEVSVPVTQTVSLWPEVWPAQLLLETKEAVCGEKGESFWEAHYQGNPSPKDGDLFKIDNLRIVESVNLPHRSDCKTLVRAWDFASSTKRTADFTAGVLVGLTHDGNYIIYDVVNVKLASNERDELIYQTSVEDRKAAPKCKIRLPQDPGSAGKDQAERIGTELLAGFSVYWQTATGDKETRADGAAVQVNNGKVYIAKHVPWKIAFIEQLRTFPGGKNDDMVDAFADAVNEIGRKGKQKYPTRFKHPDRFAPTMVGDGFTVVANTSSVSVAVRV